jgi:hypothetical protein
MDGFPYFPAASRIETNSGRLDIRNLNSVCKGVIGWTHCAVQVGPRGHSHVVLRRNLEIIVAWTSVRKHMAKRSQRSSGQQIASLLYT